MSKKDILKKSESALLAKKIFIESMHFQRSELTGGVIHFSQSSIGKDIVKIDEGVYKSSLSLKMMNEEETVSLEIVVSGIFEFQAELEQEQKDIIVTKIQLQFSFLILDHRLL